MERSEFEQWKGREVARLLSLVETERRYYQEIVATLPVALAVLSGDRSIVSANRAFRQLFGLTVDEARKKYIEQLLPSDVLIERIRELHVHGTSRAPFVLEAFGKSYRVGLVPVHNWNEDMELETLIFVEDVTELRAPAAPAPVPVPKPEPVPASKGPFTAKDLDRLPAVIWQADPATLAFAAVGGGVEALLGYKASQWTANPGFFASRIHPNDRRVVLDLYRSALERGGEASAEFRAITASGETIWCRETILAPEPGTTGVLTGVLTAISERKQAEQQRIVAERHAALTNVSGRLAHDLNNPLMIVTGYAEEMQHSFDATDPRRSDAEQIVEATRRISDITAQLLQFTRRTGSTPAAVNISDAIVRMQPKLAQAAGSASLDIARGAAVWGFADVAHLEQALVALISATRESRTRISVACDIELVTEAAESAVLAPGLYARILIEDNGTELAPAKFATLFESFFSKDPEKTEGVALAYAYSAVREWGGDIVVESGQGQSNHYTVYLPLAEPVPVAAGTTLRETEVVLVEPEPARPCILVVDDEAGIRALVAKILRREKYDVVEAGSSAEAMAIVERKSIDLLVTDVMLANESGRDLAERVVSAVPGVKVLYISGFTDDESVRTGAFPPGAKFLQKPFTLGALVGRVREALES